MGNEISGPKNLTRLKGPNKRLNFLYEISHLFLDEI